MDHLPRTRLSLGVDPDTIRLFEDGGVRAEHKGAREKLQGIPECQCRTDQCLDTMP
jgi:hypothetical protein